MDMRLNEAVEEVMVYAHDASRLLPFGAVLPLLTPSSPFPPSPIPLADR
jgi:hypothetical protein